MLDGINYSEMDAEFDSQLVFKETEDLDKITSMGNSLLSGKEASSGEHINATMTSHLRNIRCAHFAREAMRAELWKMSSQLLITPHPQNANVEALSPVEFKKRFQQTNRVYAAEIPNVGQMISDAGLVRVDASMKQLKKDIERDRLLVNGIRMVGAEAGLDAIISKISNICDEIHSECGISKLGVEVKEFLVLSLLSKASRSHSGGIAFQAAQSLIDPTTAMLMPQSAVAPPLKINIHIGMFPESRSSESATASRSANESGTSPAAVAVDVAAVATGTTPLKGTTVSSNGRWGLVCKVTGESIFKVQLFDSPAAEGYDDCSTGGDEAEEDGGGGEGGKREDEVPCMFRPVTVPTPASTVSAIADTTVNSTESSGDTEPGLAATNAHSCSGVGGAAAGSSNNSNSTCAVSGVNLEGRNTYVSVLYEDYVLFEVKLAPNGELGNLENIYDDWKETATITINEVEPMRTLM